MLQHTAHLLTPLSVVDGRKQNSDVQFNSQGGRESKNKIFFLPQYNTCNANNINDL